MTKLEQKFIELGYEYIEVWIPFGVFYRKRFGEYFILEICTDLKKKEVCEHKVIQIIRTIVDTTPAYNEMQKDLEVLKNVKD